MATEILGLFGAGTGGTQDAVATIDIPEDGVITGVDWDLRADLDADSESISVELSFIATNQFTTNDVRGRISSASAQISLTTSGVANTFVQKFVGPMEINVSGGERVHLHIDSTSGVASNVRCNLHLDVSRRARNRRSARRR